MKFDLYIGLPKVACLCGAMTVVWYQMRPSGPSLNNPRRIQTLGLALLQNLAVLHSRRRFQTHRPKRPFPALDIAFALDTTFLVDNGVQHFGIASLPLDFVAIAPISEHEVPPVLAPPGDSPISRFLSP